MMIRPFPLCVSTLLAALATLAPAQDIAHQTAATAGAHGGVSAGMVGPHGADADAQALERLRKLWSDPRLGRPASFVTGDRDGATPPQRARYAQEARDGLRQPRQVESANGELRATLVVGYARNRIGDDAVNLRSYNGGLTGPTLRARPGDTLRVRIRNELPDDPPNLGDHHTSLHGFNTTNLHTHGLHVSPSGKSDNVMIEIKPGEEFEYEIKIPANHPPGTFWYHAHNHGSVAAQVSSGMSGALIIEGDIDAVPGIRGRTESILIFQQIPYVMEPDPTRPGAQVGVVELRHADEMFGPGKWDTLGRYTTINGQKLPVITMQPGEVQRWRMIHSGVRESIRVTLKKAGSEETVKLHEIAVDGLTLGRRVARDVVELNPGYRSDVLVGVEEPGVYLLVDEESKEPQSFLIAPEPRKYLARVVVAGDRVPPPLGLPGDDSLARCRRPRPIEDRDVTGHRRALYSILNDEAGTVHFLIDGRSYDPTNPRRLWLGDVDEWTLGAKTSGFTPPIRVNHPFHIHVNAFQVTSMQRPRVDEHGNPVLDPSGAPAMEETLGPDDHVWRDTILVPEGWKVSIRTRYEDFTGSFVQHCHILDHEDQGMMELIEIRRPDGADAPAARAGGVTGIDPFNPDTVPAPFGDLYSHGVDLPPGTRVRHLAGQVGDDGKGNVPATLDEELDLAWKHIAKILAYSGEGPDRAPTGMGLDDVVKVTCYMRADPGGLDHVKDAYAKSVARYLKGKKPVMTAPVVSSLWNPKWHYEIEVTAAKVVRPAGGR